MVRLVLLASVLLASALASPFGSKTDPRPSEVREIRLPGKSSVARVWTARTPEGRSATFSSVSADGVHFSAPVETDPHLELRFARFDPLRGDARVPANLRARADGRLFVVQGWTQVLEDHRQALREAGAEIHRYLANQANVVELDPAALERVRALPTVRAVTPFHPAFKLEAALLRSIEEGQVGPIAVNVLTMRRGGQQPVVRWIEEHGGQVELVSERTYLMTARIGFELLPALAALDDVQWIDRWSAPENDMNIARALHGADFLKGAYGISGAGVRVEVMDGGFDQTHPDMQDYLVHNGNTVASHGTCTSGIVLGDGLGNGAARGAAPDAFLVVADYDQPYGGGNRYNHTAQLVDPLLPYQCVVQSNSWGSAQTTVYTSASQDMDLILFDHDHISICQSQSNTNGTLSRPEAWAKNIISVGGIVHHDTLTMSDDNWSGASIGPAADGRLKPDVASFYDAILCADRVGASGYSGGDYFTGFGGTSGATPIVAGHLALLYQMWDLGVFGNPTPGATVFENAPNNTTAKALLINSATQWTFSGTSHNLTRTHQGWGHPDLERLSNATARMLVVDEADVLSELQSKDYLVEVLPGEAELRVTMVYRDPPGTTSSTIHRINDLDLTVTSPSNVVYHGNVGLEAGNFSTAGGTANTKDTVENVYVANPEAGLWTVNVLARDVNQDSHVETPATDVDYALVVSGAKEPPPVPPVAPTHLRGRAGAHGAQLFFRDESNNEQGFEVERSDDGVNFVPLATLPANATGYSDLGLTDDTTYHYRVRAFNTSGTSAYTDVLELHTGKPERSL